jgi:hypothetical protein
MMHCTLGSDSCDAIQQECLHYYSPILFEGGMDIEECDMYYNQVAMQQNGGKCLSRQEPHRIVPHDTILSSKCEIASILRKSRYTKGIKPKETSDTKPSFVRRFSFSNHKQQTDESQSEISRLRRSNSMQRIECHRVRFHAGVHVVTIDSIDDIPHDIQRNLWMSQDELLICMHEAAIAQLEEEILLEKQKILGQKGGEDELCKEGMVERRNSNTSVIDDEESLFESAKGCITDINPKNCFVPPVA